MADKTMVDYTRKIKPYFEGIANIEPTTTAASVHAVGEKFYLDGVKVKCTVAIAVGDTIAIGTNVVAADNVETELANEAAVRSQMGAKNLLPFTMENIKAINTNGTWNGNSYTYNGITYVVSEDGVIEVSGTNNSGTNSVFYLVITESGPQFNFKLGRYKLNGCPAGGSDPTYSWYVAKTGQYNSDYGGGVTFEVTSETDNYWSLISVKTGTALEGTKTFKPMVWLASDTDNTFQPYAKSNLELTNDVSSLNSALTPLTATLAQGAASVTISDVRITTNSVVFPVSETYGLVPKTITVTTGQVVLTYDAQAQAENVGVLVY